MRKPDIYQGPWLLRAAPNLAAHRRIWGAAPARALTRNANLLENVDILGRGGGGFPFVRKLTRVAEHRGRKHVVVNFCEGEPASAKDLALALVAPHLVLDGAVMSAQTLKVSRIDIAVPGEQKWTEQALRQAITERKDRVHWRIHRADPGFISGEGSAVTELIGGRRNVPVTTWVPTSDSGVKGRPTLLSNAETYAQVAGAVYSNISGATAPGPADDPGTRLLTITRATGSQEVIEVVHGTAWPEILDAEELSRPVLLGGYHGAWVEAGALTDRTVSVASMHSLGAKLGAGIVIPLPARRCPLDYTTQILGYLAGQSALQCGPCRFGLPELVQAFRAGSSNGSWNSALRTAQLVERRGACAHPDGTARLARSAIAVFSDEAALHREGHCGYLDGGIHPSTISHGAST